MDCNMPGFPVLHHLLEFAQTHVLWVSDVIQPYHPLLPSSLLAFPHSSVGKESTYSAGDPGSIPGSGRSAGDGIGYPLQDSGLENSMDCIVHGVAKSQTHWATFTFTYDVKYQSSQVDPLLFKHVLPHRPHDLQNRNYWLFALSRESLVISWSGEWSCKKQVFFKILKISFKLRTSVDRIVSTLKFLCWNPNPHGMDLERGPLGR